ncbi:MAG: hypothetical protein AAGU74_11450 [Bacillota bacterium]
MKLWVILRTDQRIQKDAVLECEGDRFSSKEQWEKNLLSASKLFDLSRPVMLSKHLKELEQFGRTVFKPADFMESVDFDRFEIEIVPEKPKQAK